MKTRLCPPLDPVAAAELYHGLLLDLFHRFGQSRGPFKLGVAYHPAGAEDFFERITPAGTKLFLQEGPDLAARIIHFFDQAFAQGFGPITILGSDVPLLSVERVTESIEALQGNQADVVLGPDGGGGYYLLGLQKPAQHLFLEAEMSQRGMLESTVVRARQEGMRVVSLPQEEDLDYPEDLLRLVELVNRRPSIKKWIPQTIHFLRQLGYSEEQGNAPFAVWNLPASKSE